MCDIITRPGTVSPFCLNGHRFTCSKFAACANDWKTEYVTALCQFHVAMCAHCIRPFCPACIANHEKACSMRATPTGLWETVTKVFTEVGMT